MEATPTQTLNIAEFIERLYGKMAEFEHGFDSVVEEDSKGLIIIFKICYVTLQHYIVQGRIQHFCLAGLHIGTRSTP